MAAGTLGVLAGCTGRDGSTTSTGTPTPTGTPTETPTDLPEWYPEWTLAFSGRHVLALEPGDGLLYATVSSDGGPSGVVAVDPVTREIVWQREFEGEAVGGSYAGYRPLARDQWGLTATADRLYAVHGRDASYDWTALHALDRATGDRRWSFRRERKLAVRGVAGGTVVATGLEFFEPEHTHDTPAEPLTSVVYGLGATSGEVQWSRSFDGVRDVAVGTDAAYVAVGGELVALGLDGSRRWVLDGDAPARTVRAADGRVYYATDAGDDRSTVRRVALDRTVEWTRTLPVEEFLLDGDRLYASGDAVTALDPDGSVAWRADTYGQWLLFDPARETLYTRAGRAADAVDAYVASGERDGRQRRWRFDPPSQNAWPEAATREAAVATAITGESADEPFYTVYAVRDGRPTKALGLDTVFTAVPLDGTVYVGDGNSQVVALEP